jgi:hypothetical protein
LAFQPGAAVRGDRCVDESETRRADGARRQRRARLQQIRQREVVVQRTAGTRDRRVAAAHDQVRIGNERDAGLGHRESVDQAVVVLLEGASDAPPPFEIDDAMTVVLSALIVTEVVPSAFFVPNCSFST